MAIKNVLGSQGVVSYNVAAGAHMVLSVSDLQLSGGGGTGGVGAGKKDLAVGPVVQRVSNPTVPAGAGSGAGKTFGLTDEHVVLGNVIYVATPLDNDVIIAAPTGGGFYGTTVGSNVASYNLLYGENLMLVCFDDTAGASKWMASVF